MKCKKCGTPLYENCKDCLTCGYSESKEKLQTEIEIRKITICKNIKINALYLKIFGPTDKRVVYKFFKRISFILIVLWFFYYLFL